MQDRQVKAGHEQALALKQRSETVTGLAQTALVQELESCVNCTS